MTPELTALYQSVILDHNRSPRNFRELSGASHRATGRNPLCGDQMTIWLKVADGRIEDAAFLGEGCAIAKASASLMTTALKGRTVTEADALFERFHALVTGTGAGVGAGADESLGRLVAFSGVSRFPVRVKCASLAWHAMRAALEGQTAASTE